MIDPPLAARVSPEQHLDIATELVQVAGDGARVGQLGHVDAAHHEIELGVAGITPGKANVLVRDLARAAGHDKRQCAGLVRILHVADRATVDGSFRSGDELLGRSHPPAGRSVPSAAPITLASTTS